MRHILMVTFLALMLAGCADGYDKSANSNCRHLAPPDRQAQWELVTPGVMSLGMDVQTKKRLGVDSSNRNAANKVTCVRNEDKREDGPQTHDLQKIGAALSSGIKSRL